MLCVQRVIEFGFRSTTYTSITPMRLNTFVCRCLLFLAFWPYVHAKMIKNEVFEKSCFN